MRKSDFIKILDVNIELNNQLTECNKVLAAQTEVIYKYQEKLDERFDYITKLLSIINNCSRCKEKLKSMQCTTHNNPTTESERD